MKSCRRHCSRTVNIGGMFNALPVIKFHLFFGRLREEREIFSAVLSVSWSGDSRSLSTGTTDVSHKGLERHVTGVIYCGWSSGIKASCSCATCCTCCSCTGLKVSCCSCRRYKSTPLFPVYLHRLREFLL